MDEVYYGSQKMYFTEEYNESALFTWERDLVGRHFAECRTILVPAAPRGARSVMPGSSGRGRERVAPGDFSPEMQVLIACGRLGLGSRAQELELLLGRPLAWPVLLRLAIRHRLLPLLALHLAAFEDLVPESVQTYLHAAHRENARLMLLRLGELVELVNVLSAEEIPAVPYKGPILGAQLYSNLALRMAGDLDVLVRRRDVARVRKLLLTRGYHSQHTLSEGAERFMVASRYSHQFSREGFQTVEIHWAFTNGDIGLPLHLESLEPNLESLQVGGFSLSVFGRQDLVIILCLHGAKHRWDRLEWLCGLAEAIRTSPELDWDRLLHRAKRLGVRRMVLLGVLLAHDLFDAPVPPGIVEQARSNRAVARLVRRTATILVEELVDPEASSLPVDLFRLQLRERPRDFLRFLLYRLTTPSEPEKWETFSLGRWTFPVHALRRPFGLVRKLLPAARSYWRSSGA